MDTFASLVLASELPGNDYSILQQTKPFRKSEDRLFNSSMVLTILLSTVYQQAVLYFMFYNSYYFQTVAEWNTETIINLPKAAPTQTARDYTLVYHTFFMMQIFNLFVCRITYEQEHALGKCVKELRLLWNKKTYIEHSEGEWGRDSVSLRFRRMRSQTNMSIPSSAKQSLIQNT